MKKTEGDIIKICLVIHSLGIGGMERVMSALANNFTEKKLVKVDLILIGRNREVAYSLNSEVSVHRPPFEFENSKRAWHSLKTLHFLRSKVKELKPDTLLSFGEYWNNLVLLSLLGLDLPVFISDRSEPGKDLGRVQNFLRNRLYPRAEGYIAQTQEAKKVCLAKGWNTNVKVIGNPIREIPVNGQEEKENIVLTVGRLIETKHIDQLIKMFVEINQPDWELVIVGGNAKKMNLLEQYQQLVRDLGAEDRVFLEGEQEDVDQYYRKSKIFAFTSSSEGFPNVIGEALSAGLPVVAYDCVAGPSDMIDDNKNGYLIELFNREDFKNKLKYLMENEEKRKRMNKVATKINRYSNVNTIAQQFYSFITRLE